MVAVAPREPSHGRSGHAARTRSEKGQSVFGIRNTVRTARHGQPLRSLRRSLRLLATTPWQLAAVSGTADRRKRRERYARADVEQTVVARGAEQTADIDLASLRQG
jgi:hypothetical protein